MTRSAATSPTTLPLDDVVRLESEVRSYSRTWPTTFHRAEGSTIHDRGGRAYLDFFAGAGALNYGHNNPALKARLIEYLQDDGVVHSLDMMTQAKAEFLRALNERVLVPRALDYKVQFTGPTGANSVEAALKLARQWTGRTLVVAFTRAFHGVSLGALAVTGNRGKRAAAGVGLDDVLRLPFEGFGRHGIDGADLLEDLLRDPGSGVEPPAAVIVETVQGEGGVNVAGDAWLRRLAELCAEWGSVLVVDDIQVGCGRTGPFFSFERAGLAPDIVCLSKALSGYGLPLAVVLLRPELDIWQPGDHNGTFRGNNLAFVTAVAALDGYWADRSLPRTTDLNARIVEDRLSDLTRRHAGAGLRHRGRGMIWGVELPAAAAARLVSRAAFDRGLLVETSGSRDEVVKLLPPLTIAPEDLQRGLDILDAAFEEVLR